MKCCLEKWLEIWLEILYNEYSHVCYVYVTESKLNLEQFFKLNLKRKFSLLNLVPEAGRLDDDEFPLEEVQRHLAVEEGAPTHLREVVGHRRLGILLVLPGGGRD